MVKLHRTYRRDGTPHDRWRFYFRDYQGLRRQGTATQDERESRKIAEQVQARHRMIQAGLLPPPKSYDLPRTYTEVVEEYLKWGEAQGGKHHSGWSKSHRRDRERYLKFFSGELGFKTMKDLDGCLQRVERVLRQKELKLSDRTVEAYREAFNAFCRWAVRRGYIEKNPVEHLTPWSRTAKNVRRALSIDELQKLLATAKPERRIVYQVAIVTGLRKNELRSLAVEDFDADRGGLVLHPEWTKNGKTGFQLLKPHGLISRLKEYIQTGTAEALHRRHTRNRSSLPARPLLFVPTHAARWIKQDLSAAGIDRQNFQGKLDFHALRTTCITHLLAKTDVKSVMEIARHGSPNLTLNTYGRGIDDRIAAAVERLGDLITTSTCTKSAQRQILKKAAGAENLDASTVYDAGEVVGVTGFEPDAPRSENDTHTTYERQKPQARHALTASDTTPTKPKRDTRATHKRHKKRTKNAQCHIADHVETIESAWPNLPENIKLTILEMAEIPQGGPPDVRLARLISAWPRLTGREQKSISEVVKGGMPM